MLHLVLALLSAAYPETGGNRCLPQYDGVATQLRTGERAIQSRDYAAANAALDRGLEQLGAGYAPPQTTDDSSWNVLIANNQWRKGQLRLAVQNKHKVLAQRLQLCTVPSRIAER